MRGIFISLFLLISFLVSSQVVVTDPFFPSADGAVTVTFNAEEGSGGLADYGGDVYVHTGVITNNSTSDSDWKYVKTAWGENTEDTKLIRDSQNPNLYEWSISPSPEDYYGVPEGETILRLAFVFRSDVVVGNGYLEGKGVGNTDILVEMSTNQLQLAMSLPAEEAFLVDQNEEITIKGHTSVDATFNLYLDDGLINTVSSIKEYEYTHLVSETSGKHTVVLEATDGNTTLDKSFTYSLRSATVEESRPNGIIRGINYDSEDDTKVTLCLQAPNKNSVYVIGDFNNWEVSSSSQMKKDGEFFWLEVSGLTAGTEYAFQYLVDETILIPDPYADKVLDGFNDQYIPENIYPSLMEFPEEARHPNWMYNYVSVLETGQAPFNWTDEAFEKPDKSKLVVYELLIRDFFNNGEESYQNLTDTLSYLINLGVNAIELMPVTEFSGNDSWGYNPTFMFAPDKAYGPKNKLKEFINTAHENGIAVILDMVLNQQDLPSPLLVMDWNASTGRPSNESPYFNNSGPHENGATHEFSVFFDMNHLSPYTQSFLDTVNHYWINEYHFDGYRFDLSKGFMQTGSFFDYNQERIDILDRMENEIRTYSPDAYVILEHLGEYFEEIELSNKGMMLWGIMHEAYKENILGTQFNDIGFIHHSARGFSDFNLIGYMESHDEQRQMYDVRNHGASSGDYNVRTITTGLERLKLASAFLYGIPGPKMLWQFGELGYDIDIDQNGRTGQKPNPWDISEGLPYYLDANRTRLRKAIAELIKLKVNYDVFTYGTYSLVGGDNSVKQVNLVNTSGISAPANEDEMSVVIVGNFGLSATSVSVGFPVESSWYSYFDQGKQLDFSGLFETISLQPGEFRVYTNYLLPNPEPELLEYVTPLAPSNLVASDELSGVALSWTNNSQVYDGTHVYRKIGSEDYQLVTTLSTFDNSFVDNTVENGNIYDYVVASFTSVGQSSSNEVQVSVENLSTLGITKPIKVGYPNPTSDKIFFNKYTESEYRVYNSDGKEVIRGKLDGEIDLSGQRSGLYIIEILSKNGGREVGKFVKQ